VWGIGLGAVVGKFHFTLNRSFHHMYSIKMTLHLYIKYFYDFDILILKNI
jgi:hypothetical protein